MGWNSHGHTLFRLLNREYDLKILIYAPEIRNWYNARAYPCDNHADVINISKTDYNPGISQMAIVIVDLLLDIIYKCGSGEKLWSVVISCSDLGFIAIDIELYMRYLRIIMNK